MFWGIVKHGYLGGELLLDYYGFLGLPSVTVCWYLHGRCRRLSPAHTGLAWSGLQLVTVPDSPFPLPRTFVSHVLTGILKESKQGLFFS